ncbi:MAG: hypothetical protein NTW19_06560 [Planctomycetota bacterium]|nr:hypothetical protein [Planctomycetota bacterium]
MLARPDLLDKRSPAGLEVFQLTTEAVPSTHVYMEAQIFAPDSRRFVLHRSCHPHGSDRLDPEHRYLLCDPSASAKDRFLPLTNEIGPTAPAISPDGQFLYYLVDETDINAGRLSLRRVKLDGTGRETILVVDTPMSGSKNRVSKIYPLSSISSDGKRFAGAGFFGDGRANFAPWGLFVFDIDKATVDLILTGPSWCNLHPQYSRSLDPQASHDILIQENHGNVCDEKGVNLKGCSGPHDGGAGADIHVVRDDGSNFRNMPWGRNLKEYCQGHQCWRGRSDTCVTTAGLFANKVHLPASADGSSKAMTVTEEILVEGRATEYCGHIGANSKGAQRNDLSRNVTAPRFFHFATDIAGERFIADANPMPGRGCELHLARFGKAMVDPLQNWTYLLDARTRFWKSAHPHPFLSPDGKTAFFNSDESGTLQAYMIRNLPEV